MQEVTRVRVHIAMFLIQVVRFRQDGLHDQVGIVSDINFKGILVEATPVYDDPYDPVVGLVGVQ